MALRSIPRGNLSSLIQCRFFLRLLENPPSSSPFWVSLSRRRRSSKAPMEMKREKTSFPAMEDGVELSLCLSIGNGSSCVVPTPEMEKRSSVSSRRISDSGTFNATLFPSANPPPRSSPGGGAAAPPGMPSVFTTGKGPRGKTITGFLYRYTAEEISIVCVCHGSLFSPAEFVKHAGGSDVDNPLRHITVIPS